MSNILITDGIGDFLAMESFFTQEEENIRNVFYATRAQKKISELFDAVPNYDIKQHINCFDNGEHAFSLWDGRPLRDCRSLYEKINKLTRVKLIDTSMGRKFNEIRSNQYKHHNGSSFLKYELVKDIKSKFNLPSNYIAVHPCTHALNGKMRHPRELTPFEWKILLSIHSKKIVVLNEGRGHAHTCKSNQLLVGMMPRQNPVEDYSIPGNENIIDLTNKTTLIESIEILKKADGFFGIDSCLSVLASKLFKNNNLYIKCQEMAWNNKDVYYYPKKTFEFLHKSKFTCRHVPHWGLTRLNDFKF